MIGVGLVILALLTASFLAGRFFQPPSDVHVQQASEAIDVWATVEERVVDDGTSFAGTMKPGATRNITVAGIDGPGVLIRQTLAAGETVRPGDVAGVISGKTYIFLPEPLALYRDLQEGDRGDDVASLQQALTDAGHPTMVDGVLGQGTIRSVRALFRQADAALPVDQPVIVPYQQFIPLPAQGGVVASSAAYGSNITADKPLLALRTSDPYVEFVADVSQVGSISAGQASEITSSAGLAKGKVMKIGEFRVGENGARSGHPVTVSFTVDAEEAPPADQTVTVITRGSAPEEQSLSVPLTAIRTEGALTYVLVQPTGSADSAERRVPITVEHTGGGYAAIAGELQRGDRVKVS